jgi:hypothetical protein
MNEQLIEKLEDKMNLIKKLEGQLNRWVPEPGSFFWGGGGSATPCASPPPWPSIFSEYSFCVSTTLLTAMTGMSLHMQWPLTSQSHGSFSQRE